MHCTEPGRRALVAIERPRGPGRSLVVDTSRIFMKTRTLIILAILVIAAMAAEWKFAAFMSEARTIHAYHGICNGGVGQPYADFIRELRVMAESGDTKRLGTVLRRADEHSRDIYDVWLYDKRDAYQESIHEILK